MYAVVSRYQRDGRYALNANERVRKMNDEYIRLDTTIIGIDSLINKASTAEEAKVLFAVKDVIYNQQRYVIDVQPVKHGQWEEIEEYGGWGGTYFRCSICGDEWDLDTGTPVENGMKYCPNCGAKMDIIYEDDKIRAIKVTGWDNYYGECDVKMDGDEECQ